jgi:hypothetical protein
MPSRDESEATIRFEPIIAPKKQLPTILPKTAQTPHFFQIPFGLQPPNVQLQSTDITRTLPNNATFNTLPTPPSRNSIIHTQTLMPNTATISIPPTISGITVDVRTTQPQKHKVNLARLPPQASLVLSAVNSTMNATVIYFFVEKLGIKQIGDNMTLYWSQCHAKPRARRYKQVNAKTSRDERAPAEIYMSDYMDHLVLQLAATKTSARSGTVDASTCCGPFTQEAFHSWIRLDLGAKSSIDNLRVLFNITQESQKLGKLLAPFFRIKAFTLTEGMLRQISSPFVTGVINRGRNEERLVKYMETVKKFWPHIADIENVDEMKNRLHVIMNQNIVLNSGYDYTAVYNIVNDHHYVVQRLHSATSNVQVHQQSQPIEIQFITNNTLSDEIRDKVYDSNWIESESICRYMMKNIPTASHIKGFKLWSDFGPHVGITIVDEED